MRGVERIRKGKDGKMEAFKKKTHEFAREQSPSLPILLPLLSCPARLDEHQRREGSRLPQRSWFPEESFQKLRFLSPRSPSSSMIPCSMALHRGIRNSLSIPVSRLGNGSGGARFDHCVDHAMCNTGRRSVVG